MLHSAWMAEHPSASSAKYTVLERLRQEAGVVEVYKAMQAGLARPVELRLLDVEKLGERSELLRFEREFRTLATLDHPALYKVLDWGVLEQKVFYVTEWRSMSSLRELEADGAAIGAGDVFELGEQLGDVLAYLHSKGVVHRSLGMESVLYDNSSRRCAIGEFPMVKDTRLADLTARGVAHLLPELATPEFLRTQPATAATDIYLLGALLYRAWTGSEPVEAGQYVRLDRLGPKEFETLIAPPGSQKATGEELPSELWSVIRRCLSFEPQARPCSARALQEQLAVAREAIRVGGQRRRLQARREAGSSASVLPASGATADAGGNATGGAQAKDPAISAARVAFGPSPGERPFGGGGQPRRGRSKLEDYLRRPVIWLAAAGGIALAAVVLWHWARI
ncbi:MAG: protein kinase [Candidatus Wallbacteria bacterium]|nr:protein kinase [Candidatus Wallbacteria bacterium]